MSDAAEKGTTGNRRSAARLVAVQALYEMDMVSADVDAVLEQFLQKRWRRGDGDLPETDEDDDTALTEPDHEWLGDLVRGVSSGRDELDGLIGAALSDDWTVDRLEALLRVILRAGAYELKNKPNIPTAVIISEYLDVAHAFFEGGETRMVNGVLDHLARDLRTEDGGQR
ncbi:MAG: transcription antitermination factor NusB [Proteobacteria bacterium]|nr:transcription antitermination factor NusB [Pseudomonadota bacterium]